MEVCRVAARVAKAKVAEGESGVVQVEGAVCAVVAHHDAAEVHDGAVHDLQSI